MAAAAAPIAASIFSNPEVISALMSSLGLLGGGAMSAFGGNKPKIKKLDNYNTGQNQLLNQLLKQLTGGKGQQGFGNAMGLLQDYLDPNSSVYKNFEAPYMQQFEQQTVPMLAEKFAGLGGGMGAGPLSSSGFGQALGAAGANLQTNLAGMKSQMQRQSIMDLLNQFNSMSQLGLGAQPFSYMAV